MSGFLLGLLIFTLIMVIAMWVDFELYIISPFEIRANHRWSHWFFSGYYSFYLWKIKKHD